MEFPFKMLMYLVLGIVGLVILIFIVDAMSGGSLNLAEGTFGRIGDMVNVDFGKVLK